jgi:hypothetical protein
MIKMLSTNYNSFIFLLGFCDKAMEIIDQQAKGM